MRYPIYCFLILISSLSVQAQVAEFPLKFYTKKGKGFGLVTSDSTFSLNFQFRMQNRAGYVSESDETLQPQTFEFRVRRLRLKMDGFVYHPKLTYYIQLSFSRADMDWKGTDNASVNSSPNIVRDAVVSYHPTKRWRLAFGQTKLPGNRQRVISSGDLQFVDRSISNATFTLDRDFGFFAHYHHNFVNVRGAITSGEGRNAVSSNRGLCYTGRVEVLPLGKFTGHNDYIEGDQERETLPKISIGATYSYNDQAMRQAGQLGNDLYQPLSLRHSEVDVLVKYRGWASYSEYMMRDTEQPVTANAALPGDIRYAYIGEGYSSQLSYLFKNNIEVAARYTAVRPFSSLYNQTLYPKVSEQKQEQAELGVTKYLRGHRVKVQGNLIYGQPSHRLSKSTNGFWSAVFQLELGI